MTVDVERPDPEVAAGRALRRLRLSRGWSQEEVARRMQAYGYEFHQTMIAKIEGAQRPLRVRELADFAALYGAEVDELIHPTSSSLEDVTDELTNAERRRAECRQQAEISAARVRQAQGELADAEAQLYSAERELAVMDERVDFLRQEKRKFSLKPDPSAAGTAAEFIEALERFRAWAGNPAYSAIALRAGSTWGSRAVTRSLRTGTNLPSLHLVTIMITGCGGSEEDLAAFKAAWERIRSAAG